MQIEKRFIWPDTRSVINGEQEMTDLFCTVSPAVLTRHCRDQFTAVEPQPVKQELFTGVVTIHHSKHTDPPILLCVSVLCVCVCASVHVCAHVCL